MTLDRKNIAILTANGVNQDDISIFQRALIQQRCFPKIIGVGSKLITAWDGEKWGHNFAVDVPVSEALGVDYDVLIIPGGERAIDALATTAHTKRIINSFMVSGKPILVINEAQSLLKTFDITTKADNVSVMNTVTQDNIDELVAWFLSVEVQDEETLVA